MPDSKVRIPIKCFVCEGMDADGVDEGGGGRPQARDINAGRGLVSRI